MGFTFMELTQERVREILHYDYVTGVFTRIGVTGTRTDMVGRVAGHQAARNGYIKIQLDGKLYSAHRVVWLYHYGFWPNSILDHINGVTWDNRLVNLREVSDAGSAQNVHAASKNSKTGFLGVRAVFSKAKVRAKVETRFSAQIGLNRKCIYLGVFKTPEEAHEAYVKAKRKLHPTCTL